MGRRLWHRWPGYPEESCRYLSAYRRRRIRQTITKAIVDGGTRGYAAMFQFGHGMDTGVFNCFNRPPGCRAMSQMRHVAGPVTGDKRVTEGELRFFRSTITPEERAFIDRAVVRWQKKTGRYKPAEKAA